MNLHKDYDREEDLPNGGGCYTLVIFLPKRRSIQVGKLGSALFPAGIYFYTGSAMRSLKGRIARHLRQRKKHHWHIDYLLNCHDARVKEIAIYISSIREECRYNQRVAGLPGAKVILPGFGSSDCRAGCPSHLLYFAGGPKRLPLYQMHELCASRYILFKISSEKTRIIYESRSMVG